MTTARATTLFCIAGALLLPTGCARPERDLPAVAGGDIERGRAALVAHECGACHRIPGIAAARGTVGPTLEDFRQRLYIAGGAANNAENLVAWLRDAPAIDPGTAMPDLDVDEADARDMAAYLYR